MYFFAQLFLFECISLPVGGACRRVLLAFCVGVLVFFVLFLLVGWVLREEVVEDFR